MNKWFIYILNCKGNRLYTGISNNPQKRIRKHLSGSGAKFTVSFRPLALVYLEGPYDHSTAAKKEYTIKQLRKSKKVELIKNWSKTADQEKVKNINENLGL